MRAASAASNQGDVPAITPAPSHSGSKAVSVATPPSVGLSQGERPSAMASIWPKADMSAFFHGSRPNKPGTK
jgi:hypothetical protein